MSIGKEVNEVIRETNDNYENTCVVCFKNVDIYSIGECDHPVCYECSTRMRVLCQQNECPICRQGLSKVIFTYEKRPYRELEAKNRSEYYNKKYKICFSNLQIQKAFYKLLDHPCPKCNGRPFHSFDALKDHVRKEHEMFYCDICTEHLKIFSFERKCYTRQELGLHRRKGDPDNTSHRGHPLCHYCDCRYLDRDELFRHLRREHYYCHFCDADGANEFYADIDSLRKHFRSEHFLCEEGDCAREEFTAVFRTDIDLKAHIANVHGKSLGKLQAKQARTLQLDITLGPRNRPLMQEQTVANIRARGNENALDSDNAIQQQGTTRNHPKVIDARNEEEFPSLGGTTASTSSTVTLIRPSMSIRAKSSGPAGLARTKENFPALGGGGGGGGPDIAGSIPRNNHPPVSTVLKNSAPQQRSNGGSVIIHVSNRPTSSTDNIVNNANKNSPYQQNFPALPGSSKSHVNLREDFIPSNSVNLSSISAKHRNLVDDYVSIVTPQSNPKVTVVQKENLKGSRKQDQQTPMLKLTNSDFPALPAGLSLPEATWVRSQRQQDIENRKNKVAPAPILNGPEGKRQQEKKDAVKQNKPNTDIENNNLNKKDKKSTKSTEKKSENKKSEAANKQNKEKKVNNENKAENKSKSNDKFSNNNFLNELEFPKLDNHCTSAPPGFEVKKPPPGFQHVTLQSVAKPANDLTFTSSLGESYSIVPTHKYLPPPNSVKRNQELVTHFQNALKAPEAVQEFRHISQKFREGLYKALPYYEHCQAALKNNFDEIFSELLVLLPDINKQQELFLVHSQQLKEASKAKRSQGPRVKLEVCSTCKQVLKASDVKAHMNSHTLENNFPSLQSAENVMASGIKK